MSIFLEKKWSMILQIALCLYCFPLQSEATPQSVFLSKFEQICTEDRLNSREKTAYLAKCASELGIPFERVPTHDQPLLQFRLKKTWELLDAEHHAFYLQLDNHTLASFDEVADDPFLVLRTKVGPRHSPFDFIQAQANLAHFKIVDLEEWPEFFEDFISEITLHPEKQGLEPNVNVTEILAGWADPSTTFHLSQSNCELIWWQIASDKNFELIVSNFNQIQPFVDLIELDSLSETFLNPNQKYYFRLKSFQDGEWSAWTLPQVFTVQKPAQIKAPTFSKIQEGQYKISWEGEDADTTYWVFGSNALDLVPPVYRIQSEYEVPAYESLETTQTFIEIDGSYAYYRIIPEKNGRYGVPSEIIRVYDEGMFHTRTLLQYDGKSISRRIFPRLLEPQSLEKQPKFIQHPHVPDEAWEAVTPYLLPDNHPYRSTLDRIFSKTRVLHNEASLKSAGFTWTKKGSFSPVYPTLHKKIKGYYIKVFTDSQDKTDWKNWVARVQGAKSIQKSIDENNYQTLFKVPKKYIYPLPEKPGPTGSGKKRKNFILLAEDMKIFRHSLNKEMYRYRITPTHLNAVYKVVTEVGLVDSLYINNLPWAKDGRLAFVDTEKHHMWPIAYQRYTKILSTGMQQHWKLLITHQGPNF